LYKNEFVLLAKSVILHDKTTRYCYTQEIS
jgi:hypothetical protein